MIKDFDNKFESNCILFFSNKGCFPCELLFEELKDIDFLIYKVDIEQFLSFAQSKDVTSIPALFFVKNDEIIYKSYGVRSKKDILHIIEHFYL